MIVHYIKIAFRNMWKYRSQTLISLIGLAVGFTCVALATLWIVYEMTFDSFHKNAKQMYVVYRQDVYNPTGYSNHSFCHGVGDCPLCRMASVQGECGKSGGGG